MTIPVIIDVFLVGVLAALTLYGARRGMLRTLTGLLIMVLASVGAAMIAATFSAPLTDFVMPFLEETMSERIELAASTASHQYDVEELLGLLGLDEAIQAALVKRAQQLQETGISLMMAAAESLVYAFAHGLLYAVAFPALLVLLRILAAAMDLAAKLPVISRLNALGGGILGFIEGVLLVFLAVWVAQLLGVPFHMADETFLLKLFTTNTPMRLLSFLS